MVPPQLRVLLHTAARFLPSALKDIPYGRRALSPEYLGEHRTPSFDSNLLFLLAAAQIGDERWLQQKESSLRKIYAFYENYFQDSLLLQPPFSDWQDSARREGARMYINFIYLRSAIALTRKGLNIATEKELTQRRRLLFETFFDPASGLFRDQAGGNQFSLETQLWIIESGIFPEIGRETLYANLKKHPLWNQAALPGIPVWPPYPRREVSWSTRLVGLRGYHDHYHWSWLMGESAKVAFLMNDFEEGNRILNSLEEAAAGTIHEIYLIKNETLKPMHSPLYVSESPFTWGAAKIIEAIKQT